MIPYDVFRAIRCPEGFENAIDQVLFELFESNVKWLFCRYSLRTLLVHTLQTPPMQILERISIIGLGKLGLPIAACFASRGITTLGVDSDAAKVDAISRGVLPLFEPGLATLLKRCGSKLAASLDIEYAVQNSDVTFLIVPTPSERHGGFSLKYVLNCAEAIGVALKNKRGWHLIALVSTVMPNATETQLRPCLEKLSGKQCGKDFGLCYNPEFVALGSVIDDFLHPPFVLIGESDPLSGEVLSELFQRVCDNAPPIARMNIVSSEITKLSLNAYVTTKISFANMLARLCDEVSGADIDAITGALGLDKRIGPHYLRGGVSFGGPCFPRDNIAFSAFARSVNSRVSLSEATQYFNNDYLEWLLNKTRHYLSPHGSVSILGLAYKPNTDVIERSTGMHLAHSLSKEHIRVCGYDPLANTNAKRELGNLVTFTDTAQGCIEASDVVVITTYDPEFGRLKPRHFVRSPKPRVVIDCWRLLPELKNTPGILYVPVGLKVKLETEALRKAA